MDNFRAGASLLLPPDQDSRELFVDLALAEDALRRLERILSNIEGSLCSGLPGVSAIPLHISARARRAIHRASLSRSQSLLNDCQQRILSRLLSINVYVFCMLL